MSQTDIPTRLELHREAFRLAGYRGPLIQLEELGPDEVALVNADFLTRIRRVSADDITAIYRVYIETLHGWGVMCPHPQRHRRYDGWHQSDTPRPFEEFRWFGCLLCEAYVINRS